MLCENLINTQNEALGLSVAIRVTNLDAPRSEQELKDELLAHALDCHECLTVVLFQEDSLSVAGCPAYRKLFEAATAELLRQTPIDPAAHFSEELMNAFFLEHLSEDQVLAMSEHAESCVGCRQTLVSREAFHLTVKDALDRERASTLETEGLTGVLGFSSLEHGLLFTTQVHG